MTITVNGKAIREHEIAAEMQYHPAASATAARHAAAEALVVRSLLLQEAARLGLGSNDASLDGLLAAEIAVHDADDATCRRYYETHRDRFVSPELYEAHHILIAASPGEGPQAEGAKQTAAALIRQLQRQPERFAELAAAYSACPSKEAGGSLGQVTRAEIASELATFLAVLEEGQLCPVPVCTRHGFHVVRLDRRAAAARLPYESVRERIARYLTEAAWRNAVRQYIGLLAGRADIAGIDIERWQTPLVQ
jgi:peptidyl-prolyl cis-trans isomerase C